MRTSQKTVCTLLMCDKVLAWLLYLPDNVCWLTCTAKQLSSCSTADSAGNCLGDSTVWGHTVWGLCIQANQIYAHACMQLPCCCYHVNKLLRSFYFCRSSTAGCHLAHLGVSCGLRHEQQIHSNCNLPLRVCTFREPPWSASLGQCQCLVGLPSEAVLFVNALSATVTFQIVVQLLKYNLKASAE